MSSPKTPDVTPSQPGRLAGRFAPGNTAARGNPNARRMYELKKVLLDCAADDDVRAVAQALLGMARAGDVVAAKLWLEYTVGKPPQAVEVSGLEGDRPTVSVEEIRALVLSAVGGDPEAQARTALAFRSLVLTLRDRAGAGADAAAGGGA